MSNQKDMFFQKKTYTIKHYEYISYLLTIKAENGWNRKYHT